MCTCPCLPVVTAHWCQTVKHIEEANGQCWTASPQQNIGTTANRLVVNKTLSGDFLSFVSVSPPAGLWLERWRGAAGHRRLTLRALGLWVQWRDLKLEEMNVCLAQEGLWCCSPCDVQIAVRAVALGPWRYSYKIKIAFPSSSGIFLDTNCGPHPVSETGWKISQHSL